MAQPTCGYATKRAAIIHLHLAGTPATTIAQRTASSPNHVRVELSRARRDGALTEPNVAVSQTSLARLRAHATARGVSRTILAEKLLNAALNCDGIVDALLDGEST